ncbi:MAG: SDR family NAD(P)-dependent oxidoreductase [Gaiella sp.]
MTEAHRPVPQGLTGSRTVVTGASRGIGRAIAVELAARGADVALVQRGEAAETVAAVEAHGRRAHVVRADLADADRAAAALDEAAEALGGIDGLVCNAGVIHRGPALEVALADFRRVLEVDLVSVFALAQAAARRFVAQGTGGAIVSVGSVLSFQGGVNVSSYAASKGALVQLTQALANEWAPLGIRVNAVAPGYIATDQNAVLREDPVRARQIGERIPVGRWGTPEDVAPAVAFLLSPEAAYVHGTVVVADGGWLGR